MYCAISRALVRRCAVIRIRCSMLGSGLKHAEKPVWRRWSIKRSSARPLRIILPSLIVSVAFFFTRIEPEHSKIALAHTLFSQFATLV